MKALRQYPVRSPGFTLIELLVVISIIAILAAMLLPVIASVKVKAQIRQAVTDMYNLKAAIGHYDTEYSRLPGVTNQDETFGYALAYTPPVLLTAPPLKVTIVPTNSDVILTLLNESRGVNLNHAKNPQQTVFFEGKRFPDTVHGGVSTTDWQFRDPWGNPYIITLDLNYDGKCYDPFYRQISVSQVTPGNPVGRNGLNNEVKADGNTDDYSFSGEVMIWSFGPDGKVNPSAQANDKENKDNVIGW